MSAYKALLVYIREPRHGPGWFVEAISIGFAAAIRLSPSLLSPESANNSNRPAATVESLVEPSGQALSARHPIP